MFSFQTCLLWSDNVSVVHLEAEAAFSILYFTIFGSLGSSAFILCKPGMHYMGSMTSMHYLRLFLMLTVLLISSVVPFCGSPTSRPSGWSARGHEVLARRHTCFSLVKVSVVLTAVLFSEIGSSYCTSAANCEERQWKKNK